MVRMEGTEVAKDVKKEVEMKQVEKAKDELRAFNDERAKGEEFMSVQKKPFCGACMWMEYQQAFRMNAFQRNQGVPNPTPVLVPTWSDFAGDEKFVALGKPVERINRKEGILSIENNFQCKKNPTHHVCIMETKPWHVDFGVLKQ